MLSKTATCTGVLIDSITIDYSESSSGKIVATTTTKTGDFDEDTTAIASVPCLSWEYEFKLCDNLEDGSAGCSAAGAQTIDISGVLDGKTIDPSIITGSLVSFCGVKISVGDIDTCEVTTKLASDSVAETAGKTIGVVAGVVALIGLAAYAVKRRFRATSKTGADEKLFNKGKEMA